MIGWTHFQLFTSNLDKMGFFVICCRLKRIVFSIAACTFVYLEVTEEDDYTFLLFFIKWQIQ